MHSDGHTWTPATVSGSKYVSGGSVGLEVGRKEVKLKKDDACYYGILSYIAFLESVT